MCSYNGDCRHWQILIWASGYVKGNKISSVYRITPTPTPTPTPHFELKVNLSIVSELAIETALNNDYDDDDDGGGDDDNDDDDDDDDDNNNNNNPR